MSARYGFGYSSAGESGSSTSRVFNEEGDMSYDSIVPYILRSYPQFCKCSTSDDCRCGEEEGEYEWHWDRKNSTPTAYLSEDNLEVAFNNGYSSGTAAARGEKVLEKDRHHYWEVKMITPLYGTDVMVGVGTSKMNLAGSKKAFCSLLGSNGESFGFSYKGYIQHAGEKRSYGLGFARGNLVGVHLDTWKGVLQFFLNRAPLGIAFTGLRDMKLYPMISSTAAHSKMRLTYSSSLPASLQTECLSVLRPKHKLHLRTMYPGLRYLSQSTLSQILQNQIADTDKESIDKESIEDSYPSECMILDDYDFLLIALSRKRKKPTNENQSTKVCENECI